MERRTIDLNTMGDEFDPPFLVEVRCQNTADYERGNTDTLVEQTCVHNLLRCVQRYGEGPYHDTFKIKNDSSIRVHVSKRPVGSAHWSPHTLRNVPIGCDCMWPVDRFVESLKFADEDIAIEMPWKDTAYVLYTDEDHTGWRRLPQQGCHNEPMVENANT
ncbi:hypothetical protein ANCCEY_09408 [Ancylostoma ceylanicum]|uniref:Uncharacterized protein n=1 Tax=Ancylostoma ceylanicum TaxID=53326 RepID=A0A0D6LHQ0_9BILA|nr:hypothetical protein ANCCEY_09408 [Ancylostoma ceylanicum]